MIFGLRDLSVLKVLLIGHISIDHREGKIFSGGPPQYQIPILSSFGIRHVTILTSFNPMENDISFPGYQIINLKSPRTTAFEFRNSFKDNEDDRILILKYKAKNLEIKDFENLDSHYNIIIISAIANELSVDTLKYLINRFSHSHIYIDGQSFTRKISSNGVISNYEINQILLDEIQNKNISIKSSFYEIGELNQYQYIGTLIRTNSGKTIQILQNNKFLEVEVNELVEGIVDSTGSGDIFLICFAILKSQSDNLIEITRLAHEMTKDHLTILGVPSFEESKKIIMKYFDRQ